MLRFRQLEQLLRAPTLRARNVKVVTDQEQEGLVPAERLGAMDRMPIASLLLLHHKCNPGGVGSRRGGVGGLIAFLDDHGNFMDARLDRFFENDLQSRFRGAVLIHEGLQRERALFPARRGDDGSIDVHRFFRLNLIRA